MNRNLLGRTHGAYVLAHPLAYGRLRAPTAPGGEPGPRTAHAYAWLQVCPTVGFFFFEKSQIRFQCECIGGMRGNKKKLSRVDQGSAPFSQNRECTYKDSNLFEAWGEVKFEVEC
jgi:hypothetical protein